MNTPIFGHGAGGGRVLLAIVLLGFAGGPKAHAGWEKLLEPPSYAGNYGLPGPERFPNLNKASPGYDFTVEKLLQDWRNAAAANLRFPVRGPVLDQPLPPLPEGKGDKRAERLQPFVAEPFFAPLSLVLASGPLSAKREEMLEQYRVVKLQAVARLSAELDATEAAEPAERAARRAAFARSQQAEVEEVETRAEAIRLELFRTRLLEDGADWAAAREVQRADRNPKTPEQEQLEGLQLAAAFSSELSPEQRGLLQEAAMEIVDRVHGATDEALLRFSPSNSRVQLPDGLPEALARDVAAYRTLKGALLDELRAAVLAPMPGGDRERAAAFRALRDAQAGRIEQLETLAEAIRVALVDCPFPAAPRTSPIPASLAPQIADYLGAKVEAQRAFVVKLAEVRAALPQAHAEVVPAERGYRIEVDLKGAPAGKGQAMLDSLPAFHDAQTRRYTELVAKRKALLQALRAVPSSPLPGGDRPVDELLQEFAAAQLQQEIRNRYRDYRRAVLEPGLSPGQRRLLFSAAVETLVGPYYR